MLASAIRAPEGRWMLSGERRPAFGFNAESPSALVPFTIPPPHECQGQYGLLNLLYAMAIVRLDSRELETACMLDFRSLLPSGQTQGGPTCQAMLCEAGSSADVIVGLSTGDVMFFSARAQLQHLAWRRASAAGSLPPASATFAPVEASTLALGEQHGKCTAVGWIPGARGQAFFVAHEEDPTVQIYHTLVGNSSDARLLPPPTPPPSIALRDLGSSARPAAAAASPDGRWVAVAGRDGALRVFEAAQGALLGGARAFFGQLLCCAWSRDSEYCAAGGEDDMVLVFGLRERGVVAHCRGHSSWVMGLAFDPEWAGRAEGRGRGKDETERRKDDAGRGGRGLAPDGKPSYRLVSVAQDCKLALWELDLGDDALERPASAASVPHAVAPPQPSGDWTVVEPLVAAHVHIEPLCHVCALPEGLLSVSFGGGVRRWTRPPRAGISTCQRVLL